MNTSEGTGVSLARVDHGEDGGKVALPGPRRTACGQRGGSQPQRRGDPGMWGVEGPVPWASVSLGGRLLRSHQPWPSKVR